MDGFTAAADSHEGWFHLVDLSQTDSDIEDEDDQETREGYLHLAFPASRFIKMLDADIAASVKSHSCRRHRCLTTCREL